MPLPQLVRDDDGRWLCSTVGCTKLAVSQTTVDCDDCQPFAAESATAGADAQAQLEDLQGRAQQLIDQVTTEERAPTAQERQHLAELLAPLAGLRAQVATSAKRAAIHSGPHTHPVFGCKTHGVSS